MGYEFDKLEAVILKIGKGKDFVKEAKRRRSDIVFGGDFIAGFPTEDEKAHQRSMQLISEANITYIHVFPYSNRKNTPASNMPQVQKKIIQKRAKELRDLAEKQHNKFLMSQIGTTQKVLVENNSVGHSTNFSKIKLKEHVEACTIVSTKILEINPDGLLGTIRN